MKVYEFIKMQASVMEIMQRNGIHAKDVIMADIANEAKAMLDNGDMKRVVIASLAQKYGISERNVYLQIEKMSSEVVF